MLPEERIAKYGQETLTRATEFEASRAGIRTLVRGYYDIQKVRIAIGNRLVAEVKRRLGILPSTPEPRTDTEDQTDEEGNDTGGVDKDAIKMLARIRQDFQKITDGAKALYREEVLGYMTQVPEAIKEVLEEHSELLARNHKVLNPSKFAKLQPTELIGTYAEYALVLEYMHIEAQENEMKKLLQHCLRQHRIYNEFLEGVAGCGVLMSAVIISEINIVLSRHPSSLWKYAGVDVKSHVDGRGASRRPEHMQLERYINKEGKVAERNSLGHNPFLKTKLLGVLAPSFIKQTRNPASKRYVEKHKYRDAYYDYKHRLLTTRHKVAGDFFENAPLMQIERAARRYSVKMFLIDLYTAWRKIEGLGVSLPYDQSDHGRGHEHGRSNS
jgi:hypothetical protein